MKMALICSFLIGFVVAFGVMENMDKRLPKAFEIQRGGEFVGYADTDKDTMEFVMVKDAKTPGMFVAFPIFAERGQIK